MFASKDIFLKSSGGYQISRSVRFRASATAYFNRTPASASNRTTWTWSGWIKLGQLATGTNQAFFAAGNGTTTDYIQAFFDGTSQAITLTAINSSSVVMQKISSSVYRDPSAWYHIVFAYDSTQATSTNRIKIYVNGVQLSSFSTNTDPALNTQTLINSANQHTLSSLNYTSRINYFDGYMTEINFIDGQALTPSSFGQTNSVTGVWQPIKYAGTYGTNGFYLNFSDNSAATATTIGKDYSGNGNNWTPNNISVTSGVTYDSMLDVPTPYADGGNGRGNYCTANPVNNSATLADGNLQISNGTGVGKNFVGTIGVSSGKWYWEILCTGGTLNTYELGILGGSFGSNYLTTSPDSVTGSYVYYGNNGWKYVSTVGSAYGSSFTTNDIIGFALDMDAGTLVCYKNNVSQGTLASGLSGTFFPYGGNGNPATSCQFAINFGQRPFTYTPPTGYVALNTQNLPTPTISNGANYMAASTYSGTSASQSIVNSGNNTGAISFKPDLVWIKSRSAATDHKLTDSVRGVTKALISDTTGAETTDANGLTAFNTNGFTVGSDSVYNNGTGPATYVAWQWQAGAGSSSSNTSGSITSTVSVGATQGFSVVTWTGNGTNGATVGHSLGVAPKMVIVKRRSSAESWGVYHASLPSAAYYLILNSTAAQDGTGGTIWNSTAPSSTVLTLGTSTYSNANTSTYVAYCFSEVAGYSKFGSYTGNGSADGPFVYLGFRPRFLLLKITSAIGDWVIYDTSRNTYNAMDLYLYPDSSAAEAGSGTPRVDALSNGFKLRQSGQDNTSSATYIYAAFAENPFKNSLAR